MSLNSTTLTISILAEMENRGFIIHAGVKDGINWQVGFAAAIAKAVVDHIKDSAVVVTTSGAPNGEHQGHIV